MAAEYHYVRNDGTATGEGGKQTSRQTGDWDTVFTATTQFYASVNDCVAQASLVSGDFILCSSIHDHSYGSPNTYYTGLDGVTVISVNDTAMEEYKRGAIERVNSSTTFGLLNSTGQHACFVGMIYYCGDELRLGSTDMKVTCTDCDFNFVGTGTGTHASIGSTGLDFKSYHCNWNWAGASQGIKFQSGCNIYIFGGTWTGTDQIGNDFSQGDGGKFVCDSVDFSGMSSAASSTLFLLGSSTTDGAFTVEMRRCTLPPGTVQAQLIETLSASMSLLLDSCTDPVGTDDPDTYYYTYYEALEGTVETDTGTYLSATYDGSTGFALDMTSAAAPLGGIGRPLRWKIGAIPVQDFTGSNVTYTVEFTCANTLSDSEFWIEAVRPDQTDHALGIVQSTRGEDQTVAGDYWDTAATHTTTSHGNWTAGLTNTYKDAITVTGAVGYADNGVVEIWAVLGKAAETVVVDPLIVVS